MTLILFLCIKLTILHLCVSSTGYECSLEDRARDNPKIYLIKETWAHSYQNIFNNEFYQLCNAYYDITIGSLPAPHENVIEFAAQDYDENGNFVYAGSISKKECIKTNKTEPKFNCYVIANLVSRSLTEINNHHVYDFVQGMEIIINNYEIQIMHRGSCEPYFYKNSDLTDVLLCYQGTLKKVNIQPLTLIQVPYSDCRNFTHKILGGRLLNMKRLLAVLAPKPFELPSEYSVPTIFYEAPYILSADKAVFPNSMNLVPWHLLKYGFVTFIQAVGWQRVAIVTDDSEYSKDFEDGLTALFSKERLVYTVIRCEDAKCDLNKMVHELSNVKAKIVVANVEAKHAQYLIQHAWHKITWLLRDMTWNQAKVVLKDQEVFLFSFHNTITKECDGVEDNILTGLSSIAQAYKDNKEDYNVKKPEFYRRFFDKVYQITPRITEAEIVVQRIRNSATVLSMSVNENGAKILNFENPFKEKPNDGTEHCLVSSFDYNNPCEDPLVMCLMFTIMMFVLTCLLITCFFDKTSPFNDIRYQNF